MEQEDAAWLCDGWNFGPDDSSEWAVERLAAAFCAAWTGGQYRADPVASGVREARSLRLDSTKARVMLGWHPRWTTSEAVRRTASWYQRYYAHGKPMLDACLEDIKAFAAGSG
jgi:CDP-glucose 4,6-dehydratase